MAPPRSPDELDSLRSPGFHRSRRRPPKVSSPASGQPAGCWRKSCQDLYYSTSASPIARTRTVCTTWPAKANRSAGSSDGCNPPPRSRQMVAWHTTCIHPVRGPTGCQDGADAPAAGQTGLRRRWCPRRRSEEVPVNWMPYLTVLKTFRRFRFGTLSRKSTPVNQPYINRPSKLGGVRCGEEHGI